ncbi:MAG: hypothetical protein ACRCU1_18370, partial [Alsobacter sp.]
VSLAIDGLAPGQYVAGIFRLDDDHGTAFWEWEKLDAPDKPSASELAAMRKVEDVRLDGAPLRFVHAGGRAELPEMTLPLPGVALVVIEPDDGAVPPAASGLKAEKHVGINRTDDMLLTWVMPASERLLRYDVLFSETAAGPFSTLNPEPLISAIHLHADRKGPGFYRIRTHLLSGMFADSAEALEA